MLDKQLTRDREGGTYSASMTASEDSPSVLQQKASFPVQSTISIHTGLQSSSLCCLRMFHHAILLRMHKLTPAPSMPSLAHGIATPSQNRRGSGLLSNNDLCIVIPESGNHRDCRTVNYSILNLSVVALKWNDKCWH